MKLQKSIINSIVLQALLKFETSLHTIKYKDQLEGCITDGISSVPYMFSVELQKIFTENEYLGYWGFS